MKIRDTRPAAGLPRGVKLLHDPVRNKGTAFDDAERDTLGLRGLLPPRVQSQEDQARRVLENVRRKPDDLERYIFLVGLQDRNEILFYRVLVDHIEELMPIVYTPTVGQACQEYGHIFRRPRGLFVSLDDRGRVRELLGNWPHDDVRVVVVTDGERILGLGDLGAEGMGIPVGKLSLYTACAGVPPTQCLPVTLDVGTDNEASLADPLYIGVPRRRVRGAEYDALVEEFVEAIEERFPHCLIQFEDFANRNAFRLLETYRDRICTFDDDIQGTGAVALSGLWSALRITGGRLRDQTLLFAGAGEAGIGIANLVVGAMIEDGLTEPEARRRCWFVDSKGLVVASRGDLVSHKRPFAHDHPFVGDFAAAAETLRPTAIIGASGTAGIFGADLLARMGEWNERPIIFALSNPTSRSECTPEEAYRATGGRAIVATGSPFDPVEIGGRTLVSGQGNNVYIFPGVGLGVIACGATRVVDEMFHAAARALADVVTDEDLGMGRVYPSLTAIREVSARVAAAVAGIAWDRGLAREPRPPDVLQAVRDLMFEPDYVRLG